MEYQGSTDDVVVGGVDKSYRPSPRPDPIVFSWINVLGGVPKERKYVLLSRRDFR